MVIEVSSKSMDKLAEEMMAQPKPVGDVAAFTKALRKQFWKPPPLKERWSSI